MGPFAIYCCVLTYLFESNVVPFYGLAYGLGLHYVFNGALDSKGTQPTISACLFAWVFYRFVGPTGPTDWNGVGFSIATALVWFFSELAAPYIALASATHVALLTHLALEYWFCFRRKAFLAKYAALCVLFPIVWYFNDDEQMLFVGNVVVSFVLWIYRREVTVEVEDVKEEKKDE